MVILAAPALSTSEDDASIALTVFAFVAPALVLLMLAVMVFCFALLVRSMRRLRRLREQTA